MMVEENVNRYIGEIDIARGMAAILMILGHSFIVYPVDISNIQWCHTIQCWIYTFHMEMFFVLAGMIYHCDEYRKYVRRKIRRILLPYISFGLISICVHSFGGSIVNEHETIWRGLVDLILHGGGYWFLYAIFIVYLFWPLINKLVNGIPAVAGFIVGLIAINQYIKFPDIFMVGSVCYYLTYFATGTLINAGGDCPKT